MALKKLLQRLTTPVEELDLERLREFCANQPGITPIEDLSPRTEAAVVAEIKERAVADARAG